MKLITFTVVVNDWRDTVTSDENIDKLLNEVRDAVLSSVSCVADKFDVALAVSED